MLGVPPTPITADIISATVKGGGHAAELAVPPARGEAAMVHELGIRQRGSR